ncbi:TonB-dependent receptor plug domain-containing protein [Xanthomonas hyacinthi]
MQWHLRQALDASPALAYYCGPAQGRGAAGDGQPHVLRRVSFRHLAAIQGKAAMPSFALSTLSRAVGLGCLGSALACAPAWAQRSAAAPASAEAIDLDAIMVTAGKRNQSVREIAGSVSAVSDEQLRAIGAQSLADYIQRTPGVVFNSYQPGVSHVVMRGIATSAGNVQGQDTTGFFLTRSR